MRGGQRFEKANKSLADALEPEIETLLPPGDLIVQMLQDQKVSREGFGDILFVPVEKGELHAPREKLQSLLGLLDPELIPDHAATTP